MAKKKKNNKFRNTQQIKEPEKPKPRKTKTLVAIVLGTAIAVVGGVCAYESMSNPDRKPNYRMSSSSYKFNPIRLDRKHLRRLTPERIEKIVKENYHLIEEPHQAYDATSAEEIKALDDCIRGVIEQQKEVLKRRGIFRVEPKITAVWNYEFAKFVDEVPSKYLENAEKAIKEMREFVKSPHLKNIDYEIIVPDFPGQIELDNKTHDMKIYIIQDKMRINAYEVKIAEGLFAKADKDNHQAGCIGKSFNFTAAKGLDSFSRENIIVSMQFEPIINDFGVTPYTELLHGMIGYVTEERMKKEVDEIASRPGSTDLKEINAAMNYHLHREEVIVHSIACLFTEQYVKKHGLFDFEEHRARLFPDKGKYRGLNKMVLRIREIGVQEALRLYYENPDKLFEGIID